MVNRMKPWITAAGALLMITTSGCGSFVLDSIPPEPGSGTGNGGSGGTGGMTGTGSTGAAGGTGGSTSMGTGGSGGAPGPTALVALLEDTTPYDPSDPMGLLQNDQLTVFDPANPNLPLLELSGLKQDQGIGSWRTVATSKSRRRLGVIDLDTLRVFDENLQPLVDVALLNNTARGRAVCPTEQAIFALPNTVGAYDMGTIVKFDSNGSYVGSTSATHGSDLIVDEDHQVVWTVGHQLKRATTDLTNEQHLHTFAWWAVSLDLDANGGIWAAERNYPPAPPPGGGVNRLVHFDVNGNLISGDTLTLPDQPRSVRVDRNSGLVWVAMWDAGVAYRDVNGQLKAVPGLTGKWFAVEPDPLDGSRVWAAGETGAIVHVDTNGTVIQSVGGFGTSHKWLAVMLQGP